MKKNKFYILGMLVVLLTFGTVLVACGGKKDSGGGGSASNADGGSASAPAVSVPTGVVKGTGKNYTLSKDTDFKYDLTTIDGKE